MSPSFPLPGGGRGQQPNSHTPFSFDPQYEIERLRSSLANMMDLFMGELDLVKKDLYVDFGETQKLIAGDINQLRADAVQVNLRVEVLEKGRLAGNGGQAVTADQGLGATAAVRQLEGRVAELEKVLGSAEGNYFLEMEKNRRHMG